jgi:hypothetical protein
MSIIVFLDTTNKTKQNELRHHHFISLSNVRTTRHKNALFVCKHPQPKESNKSAKRGATKRQKKATFANSETFVSVFSILVDSWGTVASSWECESL